jgi:hypothetical protein
MDDSEDDMVGESNSHFSSLGCSPSPYLDLLTAARSHGRAQNLQNRDVQSMFSYLEVRTFLTCFLLANSNKENETDQRSRKSAVNPKNHFDDDSLDPAFDESGDDDADPSYQQGDGDDVESLSAEDDVDEFERTAVSEVSY